jgi:hypothetical protein
MVKSLDSSENIKQEKIIICLWCSSMRTIKELSPRFRKAHLCLALDGVQSMRFNSYNMNWTWWCVVGQNRKVKMDVTTLDIHKSQYSNKYSVFRTCNRTVTFNGNRYRLAFGRFSVRISAIGLPQTPQKIPALIP